MTGKFVYDAPINFNIPQSPPTNLKKPVEAALVPIYQGLQQLIQALINNCGIGPQTRDSWPSIVSSGAVNTILSANMGRLYCVATESLQLGGMVNIHNSGGFVAARNASATNNTRPAQAYCSTPGGAAPGDPVEVTVISGLATIGGLTIGSRYYLSTVNGLVTPIAPVAAGNIEQYLGYAVAPNQLVVNFGYWIQH